MPRWHSDGGSSKQGSSSKPHDRPESLAGASKFKSCDIVWVKMFSFPWWPGTLFDSTWISDAEQAKKRPGTVCIRFFGTYEVCYMVPDSGNLHLYSEFADGQPPLSESTRRQDKFSEKRQQEAKKYKLALAESSLLHKEVISGDKNIVPIFWGVTREQDRCQICGSIEDPLDSLLLCDQCDTPWHMQCLKPALVTVPDGDWFCPDCAGRVARRTAVLDELYCLRDQFGLSKLKRSRGGKDSTPVPDAAATPETPEIDNSEAKKARRQKKKTQDLQALSAYDDFNVLFAASQRHRPLPCVHDVPAAETSELKQSPHEDDDNVDIDIDDAVDIDDTAETASVSSFPSPPTSPLAASARPVRTSYQGANIAAPEMASYLGISRVRVYQLIKAGLPLTSFEEARAWRMGRRPGHPKKTVMELSGLESNSSNPIPGPVAAAPDSAVSHTDPQHLSLDPVIKSLMQSCTPADANWQAMSSAFCSFDTMLLQLGVGMQKAFGFSLAAVGQVDASKIPLSTRCGELAAKLRLVEKKNVERAAAKKRAAENAAYDKRVVDEQCPRSSGKDRTPLKSADLRPLALKSAEKTPRKPTKRVEVVVEPLSDDEEHIDGVTDWIGALMHARHLLPGVGQPLPRVAPWDYASENINESRTDNRLTAHVDHTGETANAAEMKGRELAEMDRCDDDDDEQLPDVLKEQFARIPVDTRSQFIAEARSLCQRDLRELRGVLRPQKRRNKHRVGMQPEQESSDICFLCLTDHHDELILLCDGQGCTNAAHMFCLTPPLLSVPSGNWLCPVCSQLDERTFRYETLDHNKASVLEMEAIAALSAHMQ